MFVRALFIIDPKCQQPKYLSIGEVIYKLWYVFVQWNTIKQWKRTTIHITCLNLRVKEDWQRRTHSVWFYLYEGQEWIKTSMMMKVLTVVNSWGQEVWMWKGKRPRESIWVMKSFITWSGWWLGGYTHKCNTLSCTLTVCALWNM